MKQWARIGYYSIVKNRTVWCFTIASDRYFNSLSTWTWLGKGRKSQAHKNWSNIKEDVPFEAESFIEGGCVNEWFDLNASKSPHEKLRAMIVTKKSKKKRKKKTKSPEDMFTF